MNIHYRGGGFPDTRRPGDVGRRTPALPPFDPPPAIALLLAAIRYPPDVGDRPAMRSAAAALDAEGWGTFLALCARHRIAALAASGLAAAGIVPPAPAAANLATAAAASARSEMQALAESRRLAATLITAGIDALLVKGSATALLAFGRAGLRYSRDIDFLVGDADVDRASAALERLGYIRGEPSADASPADVRAWRRTHKDMVFVDPATGMIVELHWRLFDNPHLLPDLGIAAGTSQTIGNMAIRTLAEEANLLYLCMHGAQHAWSRLKWLADVNAILTSAPPGTTIRLHAAARDARAERAVTQAVLLCGYLFGLDVPDPVLAAWRRDRRTRWLVRVALSSALAGAGDELETLRFGSTMKNLSHYWLADGWRYRASELWFDLTDRPPAMATGRLRWTGPFIRPLKWLIDRSGRRPGHSQR